MSLSGVITVPVDTVYSEARSNTESAKRNNDRMWQIITLNLSIIHTQGLFVVTQIAAVNLVRGKMTFAKVWVTSSVCKELFLFNSLRRQLHYVTIKNGGILPHRIEATFHTKGSRLVIMMSRYRVFTLACADTFDCVQTKQCRWFYSQLQKCILFVSSESLFWQNVCFKTPPATSWKQKRSFWS